MLRHAFKPDMHHTCLCIMTCLCLCVYHVVFFFLVCFSLKLRFRSGVVRIRSTTSVCLLLGLVLLPCGILGKMTIPSKSLLSLLASCSLFCYAAIPTTYYILPTILPCQASNPPFLANRCLAMLPLLLSPSYSVANCRWRWSLFLVGTWIFWDITISLT